MQSLSNKSQADYYFANGSAGLGVNKIFYWTPSAITTALWLDASDASTITISTGVSQWNDKSGNAVNVTQATGANQPTYTSGGLNGLNILTFDGSNDSLISSNGVLELATVSAFVVARSTATGRIIIQKSHATSTWSDPFFRWGMYHQTSQVYNVRINGTSSNSAASAFSTANHNIFGLITDTGKGYVNGTEVINVSGATVTYPNSTPFAIGSTTTGGEYLSGSVAEIVVAGSSLSTSNRQKMEGYLAWKWGLVSSLPNDHPYKNAAPTL